MAATLIGIVVLLMLGLHLYRQSWATRELEPIYIGEFEGEHYQVADTAIAVRPGRDDGALTIVCFPGFLENMRYFQSLYEDHPAQLILVNNHDYHCPFLRDTVTQLDWPENPFEPGTIEYDGFYVGLVVENLALGRQVLVHGHSRGGAVALEAGFQYPELMRHPDRPAAALLEAAVLPQAKVAGPASKPWAHALLKYLLPIVLGRSRHTTAETQAKQPMMRPNNPLKSDICLSVYSNARHYATCVVNARSIRDWQASRSFDLYEHYPALCAVIGERDNVLDNPTMIASAEQGTRINAGMSVLQTTDTNHFPTLEQPEVMQQAVATLTRAEAAS